MKNWALPLKVFVVGQLLLLIIFLFMPAVDLAVNSTAVQTAAMAPSFWGWGWLMSAGVVRLLLYAVYELAILVATGLALLRSKT